MTKHMLISHSLYTPILGSDHCSFKGMTAWTSPYELSIIVIFPFDVKNCTISLITCQSSLPDSMYMNTAQLHNHNYITVCFKQIKRYKKVFLLTFVTELASPVPRSYATQYSSTTRNYSETVNHQREKVL